MSAKPTFTEAQDAFLRAHYNRDMTTRAIAGELGKGQSAVLHRAKRLGLAKPCGERGANFRKPGKPSRIAKPRGAREALTPKPPAKRQTRRVRRQQAAASEMRLRKKLGMPTYSLNVRRLSTAVGQGPRFKACQWIEGEPTADESCKCGEPTVAGRHAPYCHNHMARAYKKAGEAAA